MPRFLNIAGLVAFAAGAVSLAFAAYILITGVIGWNPFGGYTRPMFAGLQTMGVMLALGLVLLVAGAVLAQVSVRAEAGRGKRAPAH
ncbi:hypothetical protein [Muricoccus aerilatus]|uniref:hypothetical protein n=1 Tax=Muricoccus aerilatus TaxID=452982 RepID=UPI0005C233B1|nr:hypothetical protein [Roseomonas aerilata]